MTAFFNEYNPAGFADGFTDARNSMQGYKQDMGLADLEQNPPSQTPPGSSAMGLSSLNGQGDMSAQGSPMGAGTSIGDAMSTGMPLTPDQIPQSIDPGLAMAQARAKVMRTYGNTDGANKELAAYSNLGLSNAQTAADQARTAGQAIKNTGDQANLNRNTDIANIDQQIGQQLT